MFNNKRIKNLEDEINELKNYNNRYRNILSYVEDDIYDKLYKELDSYKDKYGIDYYIWQDMTYDIVGKLFNWDNILFEYSWESIIEWLIAIVTWINKNKSIFTLWCKNKEIKKSKK